jgi:hypothetical protein
MGLILHILGIDDVSGRWYAWWSGFAGDVALIGAIIVWPFVNYRRHNCQVKGCWRIGRHEFTEPNEIKRSLCWRHHPSVKHRQLTRERLHMYVGKRPGRG